MITNVNQIRIVLKKKLFRNISDNWIYFIHKTLIKQENPQAILTLVLIPVLFFQSFVLLKIYVIVLISCAIFVDICYRFPTIGYPVCHFLKKYATPELFEIIGNSPFEAFFAKMSGPASKAIAKPVIIATGTALTIDYCAATTGFHQLAQHAFQDHYNGHKTYFKADPTQNRAPIIDSLLKK